MRRFLKAVYYRLMEDEDGESLKWLTLLILILAIALCVITYIHGMREADRARAKMETYGSLYGERLATAAEKRAMRYHGLEVMAVRDNGKLVFVRED